MKVIIVGAGWAGIAAAYEARKNGADVTLLERTDMILGTGLVGGIMRNNGRFTLLEEIKALGAIEFVNIIDNNCTHKNISFPGHEHASFYNSNKIENAFKSLLEEMNVNIILNTRIDKIKKVNNKILEVISDSGKVFPGDVFIDTTGTAGPMDKCIKYGNGCASCILRCTAFKGRVSLSSLAGIKEKEAINLKNGMVGAMSGSCELLLETLSEDIQKKLIEKGMAIIPLPEEYIEDHLDKKACQQYALEEYKNNLIILYNGQAKLMTPYYSLEKLRKIKGLENARYNDPYAGGKGNSMRFFSITPHEDSLKVEGIDNLFCAGEKVYLVGHTEAIATGLLAGYNAVRLFQDKELLILPDDIMIGKMISFTNHCIKTSEDLSKKYTVSGNILFDIMKENNLYTANIKEIEKRIKKLGNIF